MRPERRKPVFWKNGRKSCLYLIQEMLTNHGFVCPQWLGVRPSDLDRFNIPQQCRLPMTDEDMRTGKRLVRAASSAAPRMCCKIQGCYAAPIVQ